MDSQRSPALPFEVIEHALGYLYSPEYPVYNFKDPDQIRLTLCNCMLTCRALVPRSRYLLFLRLYISPHNTSILLSHCIQDLEPSISCTRELTISDEHYMGFKLGDERLALRSRERWEQQCAQLFVHQFAHQLLRLERLNIWGVRWADMGLHASFFLSLRSLTSVTSLNLINCQFSNSYEFHRVLCALPALTILGLKSVWLKNELSLEAGSPSRPYRPLRLQLLSIKDDNLGQMLEWLFRVTESSRTSLHAVMDKFKEEDGPYMEGDELEEDRFEETYFSSLKHPALEETESEEAEMY